MIDNVMCDIIYMGHIPELIEHAYIDDWIVSVNVASAEPKSKVGQRSWSKNQWQKFAVDNMLELCNHDSFCLLVQSLVIPVRMQLAKSVCNTVVFAHPCCV